MLLKCRDSRKSLSFPKWHIWKSLANRIRIYTPVFAIVSFRAISHLWNNLAPPPTLQKCTTWISIIVPLIKTVQHDYGVHMVAHDHFEGSFRWVVMVTFMYDRSLSNNHVIGRSLTRVWEEPNHVTGRSLTRVWQEPNRVWQEPNKCVAGAHMLT